MQHKDNIEEQRKLAAEVLTAVDAGRIVGNDAADAARLAELVLALDVDQLVSELVDLKPMRYALVSVDVGKVEQLKAYMPGNYEVLGRTPIGGTNTVSVLIGGRDSCGWTLDGYVIPRLASGMYYAVEIGAVG